ncbi:MAG: UDP-N-acetylmuramoyl-L-alanine--D-glutamate ligase [Alphaproteobacteria bacterium]|nr:UDP-N-acetylmuramoyl-L-alanine--D-glutamate ligase [Alphaproteobacteria bacterium]
MINKKKIKYGVFGLGLSGTSTIDFLIKRKKEFIAWDDKPDNREQLKEKNLDCNLIPINDPKWKEINTLILSPGVPLYFPKPHPIVKIAKENNIEIICDIELFYRSFPKNTYIGITGTNGKSTTTALIKHILDDNKIACEIVGNIGKPILKSQPKKSDIIVVEISSFQLDLLKDTKFDIAILLNITKDHLDRHGSMENYIDAKYRIFSGQTKGDISIINIDNVNTKTLCKKLEKDTKSKLIKFSTDERIVNGISVINNTLYQDNTAISELNLPPSLQGKHNQENIISAYSAILSATKISAKKILSSLSTFQGLKYRMEYIGEKHGIKLINDSKATNFESSEKALKTFDNIYWIAGGIKKEGGIDGIEHFKNKLAHVFLIGSSEKDFAETLKKHSIPYSSSHSLENAFKHVLDMAKQSTSTNKTLLFSPAASSFDQWKNFEERGAYFTKLSKKFIDD